MSCCLYWVILEERLSVRVLASAVDDEWWHIQQTLQFGGTYSKLYNLVAHTANSTIRWHIRQTLQFGGTYSKRYNLVAHTANSTVWWHIQQTLQFGGT